LNCPLCENNQIEIVEKIKVEDIINLYERLMDRGYLAHLLNNDIDYCRCSFCDLRFFYPIVTGDEQFYNSLQKFEWYYQDKKEEFDIASRYIEKSDKVLEVGSGKGAFAKYLSSSNYTGLDFSAKAKQMALENGIVIENESINSHAEKNKERYDAVVSFQVLEHVADPKGFIEAMILALRSGGKLIIAVPSDSSFLQYAVNSTLNMPPHHVTRWSDESLKSIASMYDLNIIDIHHEPLQEIHERWYLQTLVSCSLAKPKVVDFSLKRRVVSKLSDYAAKLLERGFKPEMRPFGHTVVAVYEK